MKEKVIFRGFMEKCILTNWLNQDGSNRFMETLFNLQNNNRECKNTKVNGLAL